MHLFISQRPLSTYYVPAIETWAGSQTDVAPTLMDLRAASNWHLSSPYYTMPDTVVKPSHHYVIITKCFLVILISIWEMRRLRQRKVGKPVQESKSSSMVKPELKASCVWFQDCVTPALATLCVGLNTAAGSPWEVVRRMEPQAVSQTYWIRIPISRSLCFLCSWSLRSTPLHFSVFLSVQRERVCVRACICVLG